MLTHYRQSMVVTGEVSKVLCKRCVATTSSYRSTEASTRHDTYIAMNHNLAHAWMRRGDALYRGGCHDDCKCGGWDRRDDNVVVLQIS